MRVLEHSFPLQLTTGALQGMDTNKAKYERALLLRGPPVGYTGEEWARIVRHGLHGISPEDLSPHRLAMTPGERLRALEAAVAFCSDLVLEEES